MAIGQKCVVFIVGASLALAGCTKTEGGDDGGGDDDGGGGGGGGGDWRVLKPILGFEQKPVLSVYCTSNTKCVMGTGNGGRDKPALFAASDSAIGEKLIDGADMEQVLGAFAAPSFIGFELMNDTVVARLDEARAFVTATGDITAKASWKVVPMGKDDEDGSLGISAQAQLRIDAAGNGVYMIKQGSVFKASTPPGPNTVWTESWYAIPPQTVPNEDAAKNCRAEVAPGNVLNPAWIAPDLSVVVMPATPFLPDRVPDPVQPGVCISTDGGRTFLNVPFTLASGADEGPKGATCIDKDHCFAYGGAQFGEEPAFIQYTSNASAGIDSTWIAATIPAAWMTGTELKGIFFAPDGVHGWVVGHTSRKSLLGRTTDGGKTWTDVSSSIRGALDNPNDLYAGFALDKDHIWVGGNLGSFASTSQAQSLK